MYASANGPCSVRPASQAFYQYEALRVGGTHTHTGMASGGGVPVSHVRLTSPSDCWSSATLYSHAFGGTVASSRRRYALLLLAIPILLQRAPDKDIIALCCPSVIPECPAAKPRALLSRPHAAANAGVAWAPGTDPWFASSLASSPPPSIGLSIPLIRTICVFVFGQFSSSPLLGCTCFIACLPSMGLLSSYPVCWHKVQ
jgi:hypothetical protein